MDTLSVKESYSFLGAIFGSFMLAAHKDWVGLLKWLCVKLVAATVLCGIGYQIGVNNSGASEEEWKLIESQLNGLDAIVSIAVFGFLYPRLRASSLTKKGWTVVGSGGVKKNSIPISNWMKLLALPIGFIPLIVGVIYVEILIALI